MTANGDGESGMVGQRLSRMLPGTFLNVGTTPTWPLGSKAGGSQSWAASDTAQREGPEAERSCCCLPASGTGSWSGRWEYRGQLYLGETLLWHFRGHGYLCPLHTPPPGEGAPLPQDRSRSVLTGRMDGRAASPTAGPKHEVERLT